MMSYDLALTFDSAPMKEELIQCVTSLLIFGQLVCITVF